MATQQTEVLLDALDRLKGAGAEYQSFLANHGPMAAEALIRLGHQDEVGRWVDRYRVRLDAEPAPGGGITAENWREHLGDIRMLGDWNQFFAVAATQVSWQALLADWWGALLPGAAASATHGLIRTAHAVRALAAADDVDPLLVTELARGLALWAARYQQLPGDPTLRGASAATDAIAALPRLDPDVPSSGPGVTGRLHSLIRLRQLPDALDGWLAPQPAEAALDELVGAAARVLAARDDAPIAYCHTVTAPAAVQLVLPHLPAELYRPSVAVSWQVVGGLIAAYASPRAADESAASSADPQPLLASLAHRAAEHGDEHVIKLAEAALRQYARTHDVTLLVAADRFRDRIPRPG